jgi:gluconolactonase
MKTHILGIFLFLLFAGCSSQQESLPEHSFKGEIIRLDPGLDKIVAPDTEVELLAEGYVWSEGPLWIPQLQKLIWSDVPKNVIYQWSELDGVSTFLSPSGLTQASTGDSDEGSNGLLLDAKGRLVICQHGDRRIAVMDAAVGEPQPRFVTLADSWKGKRFNSPNDAALGPDNAIYFTDPPYGLRKQAADDSREISFFGVYKVDSTGVTSLMDSSLSRPNGIAFSPDMKRCYVANSDPEAAIWKVYDVNEQGDLTNGRIFFDATAMAKKQKGLPDGLKVNKQGIVFGTGPGGVLIFTPEGKHLGTIATGEAISNCALNEDASALFMTSDMYIARIQLRKPQSALRHTVYFNIKPGLEPNEMERLQAELGRLGTISGVMDFHLGTFKDLKDQRALSDYEMMIEMGFDSEAEYHHYQNHAVHQAVKKQLASYLEAPPKVYDAELR